MRDAADHTPPTPARRRAGRLAVVVAVMALAGCSSGGGSDASPSTTRPDRSTTTDRDAGGTTTTTGAGDEDPDGGPGAEADACPDDGDVADVVGEPVDETASGGGRAGTNVSYSFQGCGYDLESGGSVGIVRVTVDEANLAAADGASAFEMVQAAGIDDFASDGFEPVPDLGEDAYRDGEGVAVLQGSRMFFVEIDSGSGFGDATAEDSARSATDAQAVAGEILDLDLTVASSGLCPSVEAAVVSSLGDAVGTRTRSGGVSVDEVSFATEGCATTLGDGRDVNVDIADADDWEAWVGAKQASSLDEIYDASTIGERAAFTTGSGLFVDDGDQPLLITSEDLGLEPEDEADLRVALAELALGN